MEKKTKFTEEVSNQGLNDIQYIYAQYIETQKKLDACTAELKHREDKLREAEQRYNECSNALKNSEVMVRQLRDNYISVEQDYNRVVRSRGWRIINVCYKIRDVVVPKGSLRYNVIKSIVKPVLTLLRKLKHNKATITTGNGGLSAEEAFEMIKDCKRIDIMAVEHTAYLAELFRGILIEAGLESQIHLTEPEKYLDIPYFIICPQNFKHFPPVYIAVQMEQTINSRWLTNEYIEILHNAYAVFDYSLENIKFFNNDPLLAKKLYYMPVDICEEMIRTRQNASEKEYDVLFYGAPFIDRRQDYLKPIAEKFSLRVICDKFGPELYKEMNKAKIVVNVHYYQNALLETTRLYETLSVSDCLIISERCNDRVEEEKLEDIVDFTENGNVQEMMDRIGYWLTHDEERKCAVKRNFDVLAKRPNATRFFLYRFLLANDRVTFDQFYEAAGSYINFNQNRICLSLPESVARREAFDADNKYGFSFFPGLRHRLGWIGCGMSYKFLFKKALEQKLDQILICEDDVYFPPDFDQRFANVVEYLEKHDDWTMFSGIMADLGRVKALKCAEENGEEFVYLNKMISMVFNVYNQEIFAVIASWDNMDRNVDTNAIDRYLENREMRILTTSPFLVGHKEELRSTIWDAQNTIYTDLIASSSVKLQELVNDFKRKNRGDN